MDRVINLMLRADGLRNQCGACQRLRWQSSKGSNAELGTDLCDHRNRTTRALSYAESPHLDRKAIDVAREESNKLPCGVGIDSL
jgi:hypothetical protein